MSSPSPSPADSGTATGADVEHVAAAQSTLPLTQPAPMTALNTNNQASHVQAQAESNESIENGAASGAADDASAAESAQSDAVGGKGLKQRKYTSLNLKHQVSVTYENLKYVVVDADKKEKSEKVVLHGLTGCFRPARFTAIMGASGAGKTSMLNILAGYHPSKGEVSGSILVNGQELNAMQTRSISGLVHQDDIILQTMTVREAIRMAAQLRLPETLSLEKKNERVEEVINLLNLYKCADNIIGSAAMKGVSGGERRRVSIAMELVRNPSLLFLDEPTSGLDSHTAYTIAHLLRTVAHTHHRTIVATIHQPSSQIFALFDDLLILHLGKVIYHGEAAHMADYFTRQHFQIPKLYNPCDYVFMHILHERKKKQPKAIKSAAQNSATSNDGSGSIEMTPMSPTSAQESQDIKVEERLYKAWDKSVEKEQLLERTETCKVKDSDLEQTLMNLTIIQAAFFTQFKVLALRAMRNIARNPFLLKARFGQAVFIALIAGFIFFRVGHNQTAVQDRRGALFFMIASAIMNSAMGTLPIFSIEKDVFKREYGAGMYGITSFFFSKILVELPGRVFFPILTSAVVYWMVGLHDTGERWVIFAFTLVLLDITGSSIGVLIATITPTLPIALAISPVIMMPLMIFSGFFVNIESLGWWFKWISYISPIKYAFVALAKNEFTDSYFSCDDVPAGSICTYQTGEDVLNRLHFYSEPSIGTSMGIIAAIAGGALVLSYTALRLTTKR